MLVSAISLSNGNGYKMSSTLPYYNKDSIDKIHETSFNSSVLFKKNAPQDKAAQIFYNINEWQNFCHKRILGQKLDVMA